MRPSSIVALTGRNHDYRIMLNEDLVIAFIKKDSLHVTFRSQLRGEFGPRRLRWIGATVSFQL